MKLYVYTTRYIDGKYCMLAVAEDSKPVIIWILKHKTHIHIQTKLPYDADEDEITGEQLNIKRHLRNDGINLISLETVEMDKAHVFSFRPTNYHKVSVNNYNTLERTRRCLGGKGYAIAEHPTKEAKLFSDLQMHHTQWIEINESDMYPVTSKDFETRNESLSVAIDSASIIPLDITTEPPAVLQMGFDIETFSTDYGIDGSKRFPDSLYMGDIVYAIGIVLQWSNESTPRKKVCFVVHGSQPIANSADTEIITVDTEQDLFEQFMRFIRYEDPLVILGHNSNGYDFKYISKRCDALVDVLPSFGRITSCDEIVEFPDGPVEFKLELSPSEQYVHRSWEGAGGRWFEYFFPECYGRIILDTLILAQKIPLFPGKKGELQSYKLNDLGLYLLNETKIDISYEEQFAGYRSGDTRKIGEICEYCVQDAALALAIFNRMGEWVAVREASYVYYQDINEVTTTGLTAKVWTAMLRRNEGMGRLFHDFGNKIKFKVEGGHVEKPVRGKHTHVCTMDFASLYPSIMQAMNLCCSTYIKALPTQLPTGWSPDDFTRMEIRVRTDVRELPAIYEEATGPDGEPIDPDMIDDKQYIDDVMKYNGLNPDYRESLLEMIRQQHNIESKGVYETMIYYFVKAHRKKGTLPLMEETLKDMRTEYKGRMARHLKEGHIIMAELFKQRQALVKVVMNSIYGILGSAVGKMSFPEVAAAVTYTGRTYILKVKAMLQEMGCHIIYGDTDSLMFQIPGYTDDNPKLSMALDQHVVDEGNRITDLVNTYMPPPMKMEFEKIQHGIYIDPKRYMGYIVWADGKPCHKLDIKGAAAVRGDSTPWARNLYTETLEYVLQDKPRDEVQVYIDTEVRKLHEGHISTEQLVVAKRLAHAYAKPGAPMKVFADRLIAEGKRADPGTKLPLVVVQGHGNKSCRYRDPSTSENLDYDHYVDLATRPIGLMIDAAYLNLQTAALTDGSM